MSFGGTTILFNGPTAAAVYGQAVPVTTGNNFHIGNASPGAGSDLIPDLFNGVVFTDGVRYDISLLDIAILQDAGVPVTPIPEPVGLIACVAVAVTAVRCGRNRWRGTAK